jgi:hypothetical protein
LTHAHYLEAAASATVLLGDPAVAAAWDHPSALAEFSIGGLAGHLARQLLVVPHVLGLPLPAGARHLSLIEHYTNSAWVGAGLHDEVSMVVRRGGEQEAADGPAALAARTAAMLEKLRVLLPTQPPTRTVALSWAPWTLTLDDFLTTRTLEIAVHSDDLAASVGIDPPPLPGPVLDPVITLLARLAIHKHGQAAVLRALSRAERAPASIAAL